MQTITVDMYQQSRERLAERIYKLLVDLGPAYAADIPSPEAISKAIPFGEIVRGLRETRGLAQEELGKRLGLSRSGISRIEIGLKLPSDLQQAVLIAKALNCDAIETADLLRSFTIDRLQVIVSELDSLGGIDAEEN